MRKKREREETEWSKGVCMERGVEERERGLRERMHHSILMSNICQMCKLNFTYTNIT